MEGGSEIKEIFQNNINNITTFWDSEWLNVSAVNYITFTAFSDKDYEMGIRWAVDDNYFVINTNLRTFSAGEMGTITISIESDFAQFFIQNISATPNILQTQGFFYT